MKKLLLFAIVLSVGCFYAAAQTTTNTGPVNVAKQWTNSATWVSWASPLVTIPNNYNQNSITISLNDSVVLLSTLVINKNQTFTLNIYGKLTLDILDANNDLRLNIYEHGRLTIINSLDVHNGLEVDVRPGGYLNVGNGIKLHNNASITVNGELTAEIISGHNENNNNINGDGVIYVKEPITGINYSGFTGNIVYGNTDITLPAPYNLEGTDINGTSVFLEWEFVSEIPDGFEFVGFQVFKNNDRPATPTYMATVIPGYTINGTDYTVHGLTNKSYTDNNVSNGDQPKYYVRAVYRRTSDNEIVFSGISNTKDFWFQPLPVELLSLSATARGSQVKIAWTTATEINNMGFEVQRMTENNHWEAIGFVEGNYYYNGILNYSFMDVFPLDGINYYRIKQMDYDGAYEFYGPVAADVNGAEASFSLRVVKKANALFVLLPGQTAGQLEVFDMQGRRVFSSFANGNIQLPLAKGSYILRYFDGKETATAKVVM